MLDATAFPDFSTLARLSLALGIGLFIGAERERRRKEAGLRTFAFTALLGALGGLLGSPFAELSLGLLGILVVLLNVETIRTGEGAEITTSAALLVTGFVGVLAGRGDTFTPTVVGVATAGLLAWKEPLAGFSVTLTEAEFRSAVLLGIIAFVVYPVLPEGFVDPWQLVDPRSAWITVILIAGLGFVNYVLLKLYGTRGVELTGFLGGLVNSTAAATELANTARESDGALVGVVARGLALSKIAMLARNAFLVGVLAPSALGATALPFSLMFGAAAVTGLRATRRREDVGEHEPAVTAQQSPLSLWLALRWGLIFLALQVASAFAQRTLGSGGLYAVSAIGGLVSSASAVAAAANMVSISSVTPQVAGTAAIVASLVSAWVELPIVVRVGRHSVLTQYALRRLVAITLAGSVGIAIQHLMLA